MIRLKLSILSEPAKITACSEMHGELEPLEYRYYVLVST
eukprot:COSAG02_NODE_13796_length_1346_cov_1.724138_1_plen_39_part_00